MEPALKTVYKERVVPGLKEKFTYDNVHRIPAIQKVVAAMPSVDVLFNCAGFVHSGTVLQASDDEWNFALNLNVRSQFWAIQASHLA